jgi:hypothetical protein
MNQNKHRSPVITGSGRISTSQRQQRVEPLGSDLRATSQAWKAPRLLDSSQDQAGASWNPREHWAKRRPDGYLRQ